MVITDQFVYIHLPKTGGTFVTSMLYQLYVGASLKQRIKRVYKRVNGDHYAPWPVERQIYEGKYGRFTEFGKHAEAEQIPASHLSKPVVGTVRNPYSWYVSEYVFGIWKKYGVRYESEIPDFRIKYPEFPDLTFADFVRLYNDWSGHSGFGRHTNFFVKFYFRNPVRVRAEMNDEYWKGAYTRDMIASRFLRTDRLASDLYSFVLDIGVAPKDAKFIRDSGPVKPTKSRDYPKWYSFYTPELLEWVRTKERVLFSLFPEFEVTQDPVAAPSA